MKRTDMDEIQNLYGNIMHTLYRFWLPEVLPALTNTSCLSGVVVYDIWTPAEVNLSNARREVISKDLW